MNIGNLRIFWVTNSQKKEFEIIADNFDDISPGNISSLVRYSKEKYIVWLDGENEVDWETTDTYDTIDIDRAKLNSYMSMIGFLQHHPMVSCMSKYMRKEFNHMLADTVVLILEGEFDKAEEQICKINNYLTNRNCEITRKWQLLYCFLIIFCVFVISILGRYFMQNIVELLVVKEETMGMIGFSMLGTVGATFSIVLKSGKQYYNCESGKLLNFLEILSRMIASIVSGFVAAYLYKMGIIFGNFNTEQNATYGFILICIIAGFSERLIPSIISSFEKAESKEENCNEKKGINNF